MLKAASSGLDGSALIAWVNSAESALSLDHDHDTRIVGKLVGSMAFNEKTYWAVRILSCWRELRDASSMSESDIRAL